MRLCRLLELTTDLESFHSDQATKTKPGIWGNTILKNIGQTVVLLRETPARRTIGMVTARVRITGLQ